MTAYSWPSDVVREALELLGCQIDDEQRGYVLFPPVRGSKSGIQFLGLGTFDSPHFFDHVLRDDGQWRKPDSAISPGAAMVCVFTSRPSVKPMSSPLSTI